MRIVVTGATGNVGSSVLRALGGEPSVDEVTGIARRPAQAATLTGDGTGERLVTADIATDDLTPIFAGADVVVHLAWLFQPAHDPVLTWRVNVDRSSRVFEAAARCGVKAIVYASSVGAYSPAVDDVPVDESWPTHSIPTASYGREKAYVERVLDAFEARHSDIRVVRMRPAFIFQRSAASQQRRLFAGPFLPASALRPGRLPILPVPSGLRFQALHTDDAADAYRRAALGTATGAFNLAAPPVIGRAQLGEVLRTRTVSIPAWLVRGALTTAWHAHLVPAQPALFDLALQLPVLDTSRAQAELGWSPSHSSKDALAEAVNAMAEGAGDRTSPLAPDRPSGRVAEVLSGVGERA